MDIELATMEDIVNELRRREVRFVFVGIEPSNQQKVTAQVGAAGKHPSDVLVLLQLGREILTERSDGACDIE